MASEEARAKLRQYIGKHGINFVMNSAVPETIFVASTAVVPDAVKEEMGALVAPCSIEWVKFRWGDLHAREGNARNSR